MAITGTVPKYRALALDQVVALTFAWGKERIGGGMISSRAATAVSNAKDGQRAATSPQS
jgi:hypothetical protein